MKKISLLALVAMVLSLSSCDAIVGIFKAGAYVGIIGVLLVIGLIWWLVSSFRGKSE
jgi:hypothetical protein